MNKLSWDLITGDKYWKIYDVLYNNNLTDLEKEVKIISIITDRTECEILNLSLTESSKLINQLDFLSEFKLFDNFKPKSIRIGDRLYKVHTDPSKLTVSQFIDYQSYVKEPFRDSYYKILSIFLIPEGKSYCVDYDIDTVWTDIRERLDWRRVQSLINFIITKYLISLNSSIRYLVKTNLKKKDPRIEQIVNQLKKIKKSLIHFLTTV